MFEVKPYGDLVKQAYESIREAPDVDDEPPYEPTAEELAYRVKELETVRAKWGTTAKEILAKRTDGNAWEIEQALHLFACIQNRDGRARTERTDAEGMVIAFYGFNAEVNNGGMHQFFFNSSGDFWPYVLMILEEGNDDVGMRKFLNLISIFPDNRPSTRRIKRWRQLEAMEVADPAKAEAHFDRASSEYYESPYPSDAAFWSVVERRVGEIRSPWEST
jgi:hypothetical protein